MRQFARWTSQQLIDRASDGFAYARLHGDTELYASGYSDEAALSEFLAYGFNGALPKPFTRSELADALQRTFQCATVN